MNKTKMIFFGAVLVIAGIGLMLNGNSQNNNIGAQLSSLFGSGRTNPGTPWMIFGGILIGAGVLIALIYFTKEFIDSENSNIVENVNIPTNDNKKCPFCAEEIKKEAIVCRFCGKNIQEYEEEQRVKAEEEKRNKEQEIRGKFKKIEDLFNDENIMKEAKKIRRIYGKSMYISHLNNKAKELGLADINLTENDIE